MQYNAGARQLLDGKAEIDLPRREMSVFECLLAADGRLISKAAVLDHVYGVGTDVEEAVVEVYISRAAQPALKHTAFLIRTRRGLGYQMLAGPVL